MSAEVLVVVIVLQRIGELVWARRNTRRLLAAGAVEHGAGHYPLIVALHVAWLATIAVLSLDRDVAAGWLVAYLALQLCRLWTIATLGPRWTTRIIVLPGAPLVARGPYRFVSHPNYMVVIGEIAVLPLCFGLWWFAIIFSIANAAVLTIRIRAEASALARATS